MALTVTYDEAQGKDKFLHKLVDGPKGAGWRMLTGIVTLDNSYPAGGYPLDLSARVPNLAGVFVEPRDGYLMEYDYANKKIKVLTPMPQHTHDLLLTGGQAAGDALQQLAGVVGKTAAGDVTALGGASNIQNRAAAPAVEVPAATDLSALVGIHLLAFGY